MVALCFKINDRGWNTKKAKEKAPINVWFFSCRQKTNGKK